MLLEKFLMPITVRPYGPDASDYYGNIRALLESKGTPIGPNDLLIAAHALSRGFILVTNNTREFKRVPMLKLEDWLL